MNIFHICVVGTTLATTLSHFIFALVTLSNVFDVNLNVFDVNLKEMHNFSVVIKLITAMNSIYQIDTVDTGTFALKYFLPYYRG